MKARFKEFVKSDYLILAVVLITYLILISPDLLSTIHDILPYDEAKYIDSGRSLLNLQLRQISWGPLVAVFYAPLHMIFRGSLDWFLQEAWVGRILMITLLWTSTLYLAYKLKKHVSMFVVAGVMFVAVGFLFVIKNQSDVLFSSFSTIALAQLISFNEHKKIRDIWIGSTALGLAALARIDTLLWLTFYVLISLAVGFRTRPKLQTLAASLIPALAFVTGFIAISKMLTGGFDNSIDSLGPKLYQAFEQNQSVMTGGDEDAGYAQARELFGTREENEGSVFRAILNNPYQFWLRIATNIRNTPTLYFNAFDKRVGMAILIFSIVGIVALLRKQAVSLLAIVLLWALPSAYYLGFLSRHVVSTTGYFPIIFASIGITYAFRKEVPRSEQTVYLFFGVLLAAYSWVDNKPAFLAVAVVLVLVLAMIWLLWSRIPTDSNHMVVASFLLLVGALVLRDDFAFPNIRKLGDSSEERTIHFLQNALPPASKVATPTPNFAIAAMMEDFPIREIPPFSSAQRLHSWLSEMGVSAVYVHSAYMGDESRIHTVMREGLDRYFTLGFSEGNSIIFLVRDLAIDN